MIQNYIFDFDGTLADSAFGIVKTMQETFRLHGRQLPTEESVKKTIGLPLASCMIELGSKTDTDAADLCETYRKIFPDIAPSYIKLFPEVKETLYRLRSNGKRLAIATSRNIESLRLIMEREALFDLFEEIISATDNLPAKPRPDMVLALMERMKLDNAETMVIGDTTFDIEMGNSANCWTTAVTYGNHSREKLMISNPNYIIDRMSEILDVDK